MVSVPNYYYYYSNTFANVIQLFFQDLKILISYSVANGMLRWFKVLSVNLQKKTINWENQTI